MRGSPHQLIAYLLDCDADKTYEVKEERKRRSLNANSYYWVMHGKLKSALGMGGDELHRHMLREYGVSDCLTVREDVDIGAFVRYFDVMWEREGWKTVRIYKPSHLMNSGEFSRLVQGMREECEAQGIDVMTPAELARLEIVEGTDDER